MRGFGARGLFVLACFACFVGGPGLLAVLVPVGQGFSPKLLSDDLCLAGLCLAAACLGWLFVRMAAVIATLLPALIAALCVWTIVVATERPVARGLLLAAAALTKFLPVLLTLQFLGVRPGRRRYLLTLAVALAAMLAWPLITCGPAKFLHPTVDYQLIPLLVIAITWPPADSGPIRLAEG